MYYIQYFSLDFSQNYAIINLSQRDRKEVKNMTRDEIINFINKVLQTNPQAFTQDEVIEENYIYIPAIELIKDAITGEWRAI